MKKYLKIVITFKRLENNNFLTTYLDIFKKDKPAV
jgi:hypothetical protein